MVSAAARRSFEISRYSGDVTQVVNVSRSGKAMSTALVTIPRSFGHLGGFVCRPQPPAVLGENGHECSYVPLVLGAIVNDELSYRVYRHQATVSTAQRCKPMHSERHPAMVRRSDGYPIRPICTVDGMAGLGCLGRADQGVLSH